MAQDQFGNYVANIYPSPISPLPTSMFGGSSGAGAPSNSNGSNGNTYVNTTNGDLYVKYGGSWNIVQGAAGGSGASGSGSPEGVVAASPGTTYIDTANQSFWVKITGSGNTGWIELIA